MVTAELGQKRRCFSCGMKFYDFNKSPIICPECGGEFDPENLLKSRRGKSTTKVAAVKPDAAEEDELEEDEAETKDDEFAEADDIAADDLTSDDEAFIPVTDDDSDEAAPDIGGGELIDVLDDSDVDDENEQ